MNLGEVITQCVSSRDIGILGSARVTYPFQIESIGRAFSVLSQREELFGLAERYGGLVVTKRADVERTNVPRQRIEGGVVPKEALGAVGHMLVAKRAWTYGMENGTVQGTVEVILEQDRRSVAVTLELLFPGFGKNGRLHDPHG